MQTTKTDIHPVMRLPQSYSVFDFRSGYDPGKVFEFVKKGGWAVGGYHEKRTDMYIAPQYKNRRNIHMGIDIWAPAGEEVYAALDGVVAYREDHPEEGNYGATVVLRHEFEGKEIFALYGHLSLKSLHHTKKGQKIAAGDRVGWLGTFEENGNWPPHLHYQISLYDPGEADMPGVVSAAQEQEALKRYPDPRMILGKIY